MELESKEKKLGISTDIADNLPAVYMVLDQAKSIWNNLISNAIKYTPPGGKIKIGVSQEGSHIQGYVIDTGIGIPKEAKDKIFSDFYRAKNAKSLNITGTGLGLAIVKQIIEKAGGRIWCESEIDSGSSFYFTLPLTRNQETTADNSTAN